jgi:hypothetical protein
MSNRTSLKISRVLSTSAALAAFVSLSAASASAASSNQGHRSRPTAQSLHHLYLSSRSPQFQPPAALPYAPEYGFLRQVPPNAIRTPSYTFVPGVGILGESCDLPTSACTNEYRDVQ